MDIKDSFEEVFKDKKRVLVVLAHPDDMEIVCGGTMVRLVEKGKKVRLVVTTNGGKGMQDKEGLEEHGFAQSRVAEQMRAGRELGIPQKENFNLNIADGEVETTIENIGKVVFHIRQFAPDIIITHNPHDKIIEFSKSSAWVNHRDHRHTGLVTIDAAYPYSRDRGFFPDHFEKHRLKPYTVTSLLLADYYNHPTVQYFDISNQLDKKRKALLCHQSVFEAETVEELIEENKMEGSYFEPLGYYEVY